MYVFLLLIFINKCSIPRIDSYRIYAHIGQDSEIPMSITPVRPLRIYSSGGSKMINNTSNKGQILSLSNDVSPAKVNGYLED